MNTTRKFIHQFKTGDLVHAHGGTFRIIEDARESQGHRPQAAHLVQADGPSDCAVAKAICIEGEVQGYFRPGSEWTFQGNFRAGTYATA
ncbi:hypothetical protein [Microvirga alba]|uniref:Uncharacterized protein n=1 Tax=Microvirga alba TaxID=2791025 RepID=A0A931FSF4_9HYPH|nr:hypothetical protein [Microvirga alba]MBF9235553.1 hypothetical protein [Microvirga alba]